MTLLDDERPKVVETVSWAAKNGDRSENGDYLYGKKRLREIDRRIRFLTKRLDIAEVADPALHHGNDQIFFGATVTYANARGEKKTVTINGIDEADNLHGDVSWISPIARALIKARVGDEVQLMTPGGLETLEVLEVRYPAPEAGPRPAQGLTRATRSTVGERFRVRITSARCSRSRTLSSSFSSAVSAAGSLPMSMCVMSASAWLTAEATWASTPLPLVTSSDTPVSNERVGCSAHSTRIQRSLSRSNRRLPTLHSAVCTVQAFAAAEVADDRVARDRPAAGGEQHRGAFAAVDQHHALRRRRVVDGVAAHRQRQRVGTDAVVRPAGAPAAWRRWWRSCGRGRCR